MKMEVLSNTTRHTTNVKVCLQKEKRSGVLKLRSTISPRKLKPFGGIVVYCWITVINIMFFQ